MTSCGDYALVYLSRKVRGKSVDDFLAMFSERDHVGNYDKVGDLLEEIIKAQIKLSEWDTLVSLSVSSSCHCVGKKGSLSNRPQASWLLDPQVVERPFIKRLLLENLDLFETRPPRICYCYGSWQDKLDSMQKHSI